VIAFQTIIGVFWLGVIEFSNNNTLVLSKSGCIPNNTQFSSLQQ